MSVGELSGASPSRRLDALHGSPAQVVDGVCVDGVPCGGALRDEHYRPEGAAVPPRPRLPDHGGSLPSSAIHELRTPLTSIHGYAQILQRSLADNPRAANALAVIVRESSRLTQMLAELSEVVELGSPSARPAQADVDLREVAEAAADAVSRHDQGNHQIVVEGNGHVVGDCRRISQAVSQVLENAASYSPEATPITVTITESAECARIAVVDQGIGVLPEDAERIYEPFTRGGNARQLGGRGLGLGLSIAHGALALEGGTVRHEARPTGGTVFTIELPRR